MDPSNLRLKFQELTLVVKLFQNSKYCYNVSY